MIEAVFGRQPHARTHRARFNSRPATQPGIAAVAARPSPLGPASIRVEPDFGGTIAAIGQTTIALTGIVTPNHPPLTELLAAFRRGDQAAFDQIGGPYIALIVNPEQITLLRDAMGAASVLYTQQAQRLVIASSMRRLLELSNLDRRIDPAALAQYLTFSFVAAPRTMLRGIHALPAGHALRVGRGGGAQLSRVTSVLPREPLPLAQCPVQQLRQTVGESVEQRLPGSDPVALFLSGGIDSSIVAAELASRASGPVHSFAIHFGRRYRNELVYAAAVAKRLKLDHQEVLIDPGGFLPQLRTAIDAIGNPIGDPITVPNYQLAGIVANRAGVVFNGEGGDPVFGGPKNLPMMLSHWYATGPFTARQRAQTYLASFRRAYELIDTLLTPELRREVDPKAHLEAVVQPYLEAPSPAKLLHRLQWLNCELKGANLILPKVEAVTRAHGLGVRSPLFDQRLAQLAFSLPARAKLRAGVEKWVLKQAYRDALPATVVDRPKSGMRVPVHFWFRRELRRYARKILSPRSLRRGGILNPQSVRGLMRFEAEGGRYGIRLWMLLTLEIWRRIYIDGETL